MVEPTIGMPAHAGSPDVAHVLAAVSASPHIADARHAACSRTCSRRGENISATATAATATEDAPI
jgi:hypothetical protein